MKSTLSKIAIFVFGLVLGVLGNQSFGQSKKDNSVTLIDNKVTYEVPMAYELMHIAMALTDTTIVSNGYNVYHEVIDTRSIYYKEVMMYFGRYKNHKLIQELNKLLSKNANNYTANLHMSYNSIYTKNAIKKAKQYPYPHRLAYHFKSVKRKALSDFAKASNFQHFYNQHKDFYASILQDVKQNANVSTQQVWLEKEFSSSYDYYNIIISPLMYGTHFTKRIGNKSLMFVAKFENDNTLTKTINSAKYTGIVMTEIDHNYVNPVSDKYKKELDIIMGEGNRAKWTGGAASNSYKTGYKVFNEYMTHSVYLLFMNQELNSSEQQVIENSKINGMKNRRKFIKFDKFYEKLKQLYQTREPNETISNLYPKIIEWCKRENAE